MKMKKVNLCLIFILIGCFLYLGAKLTYNVFESSIGGVVNNRIAGIHLRINGFDVSNNNGVLNNRVILDNTVWTSTHTREEKISPGSSGTIYLELDPTGTEVAVMYEFQFVDKQIDDDKLLTFGTITSDSNLVRTDVDTYTGIISLADLTNNNNKIHINVNFYFDYLHDIEGITEDNQELDDLFEIHFHAIQYNGETIVPYVENNDDDD